MDTLDQAWVLKRVAHTYAGAQALEVTRLTGLLTIAYMHQHQRRPDLPFGGYYALGVCQDGVAAIEEHMTGSSTLFPNTADATLFDDPRDAEVNQLISAIPKDRGGDPPQPERVFGSASGQPRRRQQFQRRDDSRARRRSQGELRRMARRRSASHPQPQLLLDHHQHCHGWCRHTDCARSASSPRMIRSTLPIAKQTQD